MQRFYTTGDIAGMIGVSASSVYRWLKANKLHASRTAGGHFRVSRAQLTDFLIRYGWPADSMLEDEPAINL